MILDKLAKPTQVIRSGMKVGAFFQQCVEHDVAGLPFVNHAGEVVGRISMRHIFKQTCIPKYVLDAAHLLGDDIEEVNIPRQRAFDLLEQPVDGFLLNRFPSARPSSPVIKGLAIMEQQGSSYIFIIDDDGYQGIVTHQDIARRMIEHTKNFKI